MRLSRLRRSCCHGGMANADQAAPARDDAYPGAVSRTLPGRAFPGRMILSSTLAIAACAACLSGFVPRADAATLTDSAWSSSSTTLGAADASYTYAFTVATSSSLTSVTMTVPAGTAGTPAVGTVSPDSLTGGSIALAGTTLTYSFTSAAISAGAAVSIQVDGLTNTATAGSYTSEITTGNLGSPVDTGVTPAVSFADSQTLTSPGSLSWADTLNGNNQSAVDTVPADQQLTVDDTTGAGWHIAVSATTFTSGTDTLPDSGTFVFTGSISAATASSAPSSSCLTTCTLPGDTVTYPVAITTAPSSPPAATIYDTPAGSGEDAIILGGHSAADPIGWWINVPANALIGTYTSTVTLTITSGP
jgi:hypothetical protein